MQVKPGGIGVGVVGGAVAGGTAGTAAGAAAGAAAVHNKKQVGDYILEKSIGFGSFSTVYEGRNVKTREKVAVKSINLHRINLNSKHQTNLKQEIDILRKCQHTNIVQLLHTYQTSNHIYLVMQFCSGGDLHRFVQKNGPLKEPVAQYFSRQLANGLFYLHSNKIVHRDLKPQNLLLSEENEQATLRIADFGFARHFNPTTMVDTMCGSPLYMAPEILKFTKYDSKVDLWSAGTIIYQMVTKEPPFNGNNHIQLLEKIEKTQVHFPSHLSPQCVDLLKGLLQTNPKQRMSWDEFFRHQWLREPKAAEKKNDSEEDEEENKEEKNNNRNKKKVEEEEEEEEFDELEEERLRQYGSSAKKEIPNTNLPISSLHNRNKNNNAMNAHNINNPHQINNPIHTDRPSDHSSSQPQKFRMDGGDKDDFVVVPSDSPNKINEKANTSANNKNEEDGNNSNASSDDLRGVLAEVLGELPSLNLEELKNGEQLYGQLKRLDQYGNALLLIGDRKVSQDEVGNALLLYLKGLDLYEDIITQIQTWLKIYYVYLKDKKQRHNHKNKTDEKKTTTIKIGNDESKNNNNNNNTNNHNNNNTTTTTNETNLNDDSAILTANAGSNSPTISLKKYAEIFTQLLLESTAKHNSYCQRGQAIRRLCEQDLLTFQMSARNVNEMLYKEAIEMSRKAVSDRMLGEVKSVQLRLEQAQILFDYLLSLPHVLSTDKITLHKFSSEIGKHLATLKS